MSTPARKAGYPPSILVDDAPAGAVAPAPAPSRGGVLLVGNLPAGPLVGGVEVGVEMLMSSELVARHGITLFNTARRRDPSRPLRQRLGYQLRRFGALGLEIARRRPRIVHVKATIGVNYWQGIGYSAIARLLGRRVLLQLHGGDLDLWYDAHGRIKRWAARNGLRFPTELVVLSQYWRSFVSGLRPDRPVRIVPNGVRAELACARTRRDDGELRVLTLGALGERKGHFDILAAAAALEDPSVRFIFAGTDEFGGEEAALRERARALGVEGRVEFAGAVVDDAKWRLLADSDVFLLPSHAENMPNALLEAMAARLPVVCTAVGAMPEMVGDGALVVPTGDAPAIAAAIRTLRAAPERRAAMGRDNRARVESRFAFTAVAEMIDALYRDSHA